MGLIEAMKMRRREQLQGPDYQHDGGIARNSAQQTLMEFVLANR